VALIYMLVCSLNLFSIILKAVDIDGSGPHEPSEFAPITQGVGGFFLFALANAEFL
jgi:hypothetical protein